MYTIYSVSPFDGSYNATQFPCSNPPWAYAGSIDNLVVLGGVVDRMVMGG